MYEVIVLVGEWVVLVCNVFVMDSMLCDVVWVGIVCGVFVLWCDDVVGKMGMLNGLKDVWFVGYLLGIVVVVWFGYDMLCLMGCVIGVMFVLLVWFDYMKMVVDGCMLVVVMLF